MKVDWRIAWYSVVLWIAAIAIGGFVIIPWFYLALPLVVIWLTMVYFKKTDKSLRWGLWVALVWFLIVASLDLLEIIGPYYSNAAIYFSDFRNWMKYPLILLTPVIYSIFLENSHARRNYKRGKILPAV